MILRFATLAAVLHLMSAPPAFAQDHIDAARNAAEAALVAAVHGPADQRVFEALFMDTVAFVRIEPETYVAMQQAKAEGRTSFENIQPRLWAVEPEPGARAVAVYLSEEAFNNHHNGHHWISLSGRNLLIFAKANSLGVWITDAGAAGERSDGHSAHWTLEEVSVVLSRNPPQAPDAQ